MNSNNECYSCKQKQLLPVAFIVLQHVHIKPHIFGLREKWRENGMRKKCFLPIKVFFNLLEKFNSVICLWPMSL